MQPSLVIGLPDAALYSGCRIFFIFYFFIRSPSVLLQNTSCQSTTKLKRLLSAFCFFTLPTLQVRQVQEREAWSMDATCFCPGMILFTFIIYDFIQHYFLLLRRPTTLWPQATRNEWLWFYMAQFIVVYCTCFLLNAHQRRVLTALFGCYVHGRYQVKLLLYWHAFCVHWTTCTSLVIFKATYVGYTCVVLWRTCCHPPPPHTHTHTHFSPS